MNDSPVAARRNKAETNPRWAMSTLGFLFRAPLLEEISPKTIPSHSNFNFKLLKSFAASTEAAVCVNLPMVLSTFQRVIAVVRSQRPLGPSRWQQLATSGNGIFSGIRHKGVEKQVGPDLGVWCACDSLSFILNRVFVKDRWNGQLCCFNLCHVSDVSAEATPQL